MMSHAAGADGAGGGNEFELFESHEFARVRRAMPVQLVMPTMAIRW